MVIKKSLEKKLRHNTDLVFWSLCVMITLLSIIFLLNLFQMQNEIDRLQDEIALMPHYECWNKTTTRTLELKLGNGTSPFYFVEDNEQFVCQDGVKYESIFNLIELWVWDDSKTCLITRTEETCTFNKKVALLGADE